MISSDPARRVSVEPRIGSLIHDAITVRSNNIKSVFQLQVPKNSNRNAPLTCNFQLPGDSSCLPPLDINLRLILTALSPHILISIFELLLNAGQIIFVSSRVSMITLACQSCLALMWPLSWDFGIYIPIYPNSLPLDALGSPNASIFGILRSHPEFPGNLSDLFQYNDSLMVIDLDSNGILIGPGCKYNKLPQYSRDTLVERIQLVLTPSLIFADVVDPDWLSVDSPSLTFLKNFGSPKLQVSAVNQVRFAFLMVLRELCDSSYQEGKPTDEFKAAFLASPIYSIYTKNSNDTNLLKRIARMTEEQALNYLLFNQSTSIKDSPPCHAPSSSFTVSEATLVPNEGLSASGLTFYKSLFPVPNQRAVDLYNQAEAAYTNAKATFQPPTVIADWIMVMVWYLSKVKRHHDCLKLLSELESDHPIFYFYDFIHSLMESLTAQELDVMAARGSGDRLGDAARQFIIDIRAKQQFTTTVESKELYNYIYLHEDTASDQKLFDLVTPQSVNAFHQGTSMLSTAVTMIKLRIAGVLLRYGASPELDQSKSGITHVLCSTKPRDEISYLLSVRILCLALARGLNINRGDQYQATPFSTLCIRPAPFMPMMYFFLHHGTDVHSCNVDGYTPSYFIIKNRMNQLENMAPLALLLEMGTNPMVSDSGADNFKAIVTAASDAITNQHSPTPALLEGSRYLTSKYTMLRNMRTELRTQNGNDSVSSATGTITSASSTAVLQNFKRTFPPGVGPSTATADTIQSLQAQVSPNTATNLSMTLMAPAIQPKVTDVIDAFNMANYAIVEAQFRQLAILSTLVHRYLQALQKRKRKAGLLKRKTAHVDAALSLLPPLFSLLSHHSTLSVDIRHHTTMNGSRPSVAACISSKIGLLQESYMEYNTLFLAGECSEKMEALDTDDMAGIYGYETEVLSSIVGSFGSQAALPSKLFNEVLEFPTKLSVLVEELHKTASHVPNADTGKIQLLNSQLEHLRRQQDLKRHESIMARIGDEIGSKLSGIPQFSFMIAPGTSLLNSGPLKAVKIPDNIRVGENANRIQSSDITPCRAYLFATGDDSENKGFIVVSYEGGSNTLEKKQKERIALKKAVIFDIPPFSYNFPIPQSNAVSSSSLQTSSNNVPTNNPDSVLQYGFAVVVLHPSSVPHEFYLFDCPSAESKSSWLSILYRVCFEGRNWFNRRHMYQFYNTVLGGDYEGWLDYYVDNEHFQTVITHYFTLKGNKLIAKLSPQDTTPVVIIFLDDYSLSINEERLPHMWCLEPTRHLAPRYIFNFGLHSKLLSKSPSSSSSLPNYYSWKHVLKHFVTGYTPIHKPM